MKFKIGDLVRVRYFRLYPKDELSSHPIDAEDALYVGTLATIVDSANLGGLWDYRVKVPKCLYGINVLEDQLTVPEFMETELYKTLNGESDGI